MTFHRPDSFNIDPNLVAFTDLLEAAVSRRHSPGQYKFDYLRQATELFVVMGLAGALSMRVHEVHLRSDR